MFVNCSNHRSEYWGEKQRRAAEAWGEIVDYPFPNVEADSDEAWIEKTAQNVANELFAMHPDAVMCQGEFTLTYALVTKLKAEGINVVSACSNRKVTEHILEDGRVRKETEFQFVRYRQY